MGSGADIRKWTSPEFEYIRAGLNEGDQHTYNLVENPDSPGYQWEALDDDDAQAIIEGALAPYISAEVTAEADAEDLRRGRAFHGWWAGNAPDADDLDLGQNGASGSV